MKKIYLLLIFILSYNAQLPCLEREPLTIIEQASFDDLLQTARELSVEADFDTITRGLFNKLKASSAADTARMSEHQQMMLTHQGKAMRYSFEKVGTMPSEGFPLYICLHGGGGTGHAVNDGQWYAMQQYYKQSVNNAIYIAPRGISDTWDLHFNNESYALYQKLIENMILFEEVDPNRIYLLGFSAGGDGVYQIVPRMASRFAGANMSAGHSNQINLVNLRNTPLLMQMGERDSSYNRNRNVVESFLALQKLQKEHGGYEHELALHSHGSHNSWRDNDPSGSLQPVIEDPIAWFTSGSRNGASKNTNAIHWLKVHTRNAHPQKLVWDTLTTTPDGTSAAIHYVENQDAKEQIGSYKRLFYWLDLNKNPKDKYLGQIIASYDMAANQIDIEEIQEGVTLKILLHHMMVNFSRRIFVSVKGNIVGSLLVAPRLDVMARTLLERADPSSCYQAEIELFFDNAEGWKILGQ